MLAPDIRFGKSFIIIAAISPLLYFPNYKPNLVFIIIIIILFRSFVIDFNNYNNIKHNIKRITYDNSNIFITPQLVKMPLNLEFKTYYIGGVNIYTPINGERCFDHKIPCTPYRDNTLLLRNNTLQSGFKHSMEP